MGSSYDRRDPSETRGPTCVTRCQSLSGHGPLVTGAFRFQDTTGAPATVSVPGGRRSIRINDRGSVLPVDEVQLALSVEEQSEPSSPGGTPGCRSSPGPGVRRQSPV
ncbi:Hypothetical predicted protein [Marmota monax]|uniref:Uncharacterized protein n=1 Tax=Marmota monax TaxID=9995 RepID=A0A5E4CVQ5_MARMO|nr:Hypothetical predicted protein [Marmota monax]